MTLKGGLVLALPLCLVLAIGCDKANPHAPASVTGKVTYKGNPVTAGTVTFNPNSEGPFSSASLNEDGTYTINEAPAGDFTVTVDTESFNPDRKKATYGPGGAGAGATSPPPAGVKTATPTGKYVKIPKKYSDPKASPLTAKLGAGKQTVNFPLEE
jgi:hypothetical protein